MIDSVLVEKASGVVDALLAEDLSQRLAWFVAEGGHGVVVGAACPFRFAPRLVRIPDVAFVSWDRLPEKVVPQDPIPDLAPDLAVEVLSEGNTAKEMERKLKDYFFAGVRLVWLIDPAKRAAEAYAAPDACEKLGEDDALDGAAVLPGFSLPQRQLFARVGPHPAPKGGRRKKES